MTEEIERLHEQAMELADQAYDIRATGRDADAITILKQALEAERQAADLLPRNLEPSRSVLYRSAASLALEIGDTREAERLAALGLSGDPPGQIADELREFLEDVNAQKHLQVRGVVLTENEVQLSFNGNAIGFGFSPVDQFMSRVKAFERLLLRTAERQAQHGFRSKGLPKAEARKVAEVFLSVPRAASFAVTMRLAHRDQAQLPAVGASARIIDEALQGIEIVELGSAKDLEALIPQGDYRLNFVALVKTLAPDGKAVTQVGFTATRGEVERRVLMTRTREEVPAVVLQEDAEVEPAGTPIELVGTLLFADDLRGRVGAESFIRLVEHPRTKIRVPHALMEDIVKPLWGKRVRVDGSKVGRIVKMRDVTPLDE